jgi:hypothetical protein
LFIPTLVFNKGWNENFLASDLNCEETKVKGEITFNMCFVIKHDLLYYIFLHIVLNLAPVSTPVHYPYTIISHIYEDNKGVLLTEPTYSRPNFIKRIFE